MLRYRSEQVNQLREHEVKCARKLQVLTIESKQPLTRFVQIKNKEEYLVTCKVLESVNEMLHAGQLAELMTVKTDCGLICGHCHNDY